MAGTAFGQDENLIVVVGADGLPVHDATVSAYDGTEIVDVATGTANDSWYQLHTGPVKATIIVEHESFGTRSVATELQAAGTGATIVQVTAEGAFTKWVDFRVLRDVFGDALPGNPVTPPPGQGCFLPDQVNAFYSDATTIQPVFSADCFEPSGDANLTHCAFWGGYIDLFTGSDHAGLGDDFRIEYYDDNNGLPGNVIASFNPGLAQKFATGNLIAGFVTEYQYITNFHAPVPVTAGTSYWIGISNNSPSTQFEAPAWFWSTSADGDGFSAQSLNVGDDPANNQVTGNLAYCVSAQVDPSADCAPPVVAPANDDCADCEAISGEGIFGFDNTNASLDGTADPLCDFFGQTDIDNDVWYCWTAPCTDTATLTTVGLTSVDTKVAVYDSTACPTGAPVVCNDDDVGLQSTVQWAAVSGQTYLIRMGTFPGAAGGTGSMDISCGTPAAPANDDCANAAAIGINGIDSGDTTLATPDVVPDCVTVYDGGPGVWYSVTGNGNQLVASLCSGNTLFDSKLFVFCGGCGAEICVNGNDDTCGLQSEVVWDTTNGVDYLIYIHGWNGAAGAYELGVFDIGANTGTPVACSSAARQSMTITSNLPNVFVGVDPIDDFTQGSGLTPFERSYSPETQVTLTFPTQVDAKRLMGFMVNGRILRGSQGGVLSGKASKAQMVKAFYNDNTTGGTGTQEETY